MEGINPDLYLSRFKESGPTSERQELIGRIEQFTNQARKRDGFKDMWTPSFIAKKVKKLSTLELRDRVVQAEKADETSRLFWGLIKKR
jgi:hypothetical protein